MRLRLYDPPEPVDGLDIDEDLAVIRARICSVAAKLAGSNVDYAVADELRQMLYSANWIQRVVASTRAA